MNEELLLKIEPVVRKLQAYHRYEVKGIENVPESGPALLVCSHSLATYDIALLGGKIYHVYHRILRSLVDHTFFKFPLLGEIMEATGAVEGNRDAARDLLMEGNLVSVAPGGMLESLRTSDERYQIRWDNRKGFAKVAIDTQVPIILAACPRADDIYTVYDSPVTKWAYELFKFPVFIARGLGPTPIPRPVKLVHFLSEPILPPKKAATEAGQKRQLTVFHKKLVGRMEELIGEAVAYRVK